MKPFVTARLDPKAQELLNRLGFTPELAQKLAQGIDKSNQISVDEVKAKLSGPVLKRRSGRLRDSIGRTDAIITVQNNKRMTISSAIGSGVGAGQASVRYAAIHEFGGVIPAHTIKPKNARALHFTYKGKEIFAKSVRIPDVTMPRRSYLGSTIKDRMHKYGNRLSRIIIEHWTGGKGV